MEYERKKLGAGAYVIGGLSFIPLIGVIFGIISIIWGLATNKSGGKILAVIGTLGILSTVITYGWAFYEGFIKDDSSVTGLLSASNCLIIISFNLSSIDCFSVDMSLHLKACLKVNSSFPCSTNNQYY